MGNMGKVIDDLFLAVETLKAERAALRAENAKLREALETIATPSVEYDNNTLQAIRHIAKMVSIANTALGGK